MKRSGNHVVARWFTELSGRCFVNNFVPISRNGILRVELPKPRDYLRWVFRHVRTGKCRNPFSHLLSLEDLPLDWSPFRQSPSLTLLVIRSPLNMFASRLQKGFKTSNPAYPVTRGETLNSQVEMWKSYARAGLEPDKGNNKVVILFDEFVANTAYRRKTAGFARVKFGLEPDMSAISPEGGGSSFTGTEGNADLGFISDVISRANFLDGPARAVLEDITADEELGRLWESLLSKFAV